MRDTLEILEEGNQPHPKGPRCDMFVPRRALKFHHSATEIWRRGEKHTHFRLVLEEAREGNKINLTTYGHPSWKYPTLST